MNLGKEEAREQMEEGKQKKRKKVATERTRRGCERDNTAWLSEKGKVLKETRMLGFERDKKKGL